VRAVYAHAFGVLVILAVLLVISGDFVSAEIRGSVGEVRGVRKQLLMRVSFLRGTYIHSEKRENIY
jgi:hypothetical protein